MAEKSAIALHSLFRQTAVKGIALGETPPPKKID